MRVLRVKAKPSTLWPFNIHHSLAEGHAERMKLAEKLRTLDAEARRLSLKGEKPPPSSALTKIRFR